MTEALISAGSAIIVCVISNYFLHNKTQALIEYKIDQLSERVDKHNNAVERLYEVEKTLVSHDEKIKGANRRIDDLEEIAPRT